MESIGPRLRSAREAKGISLEQAQKDTRISSRILAALEADKIDEIVSGPVYAKSFIKKYAGYLGLDGTAMADGFLGEKPEFKEQISVLAKNNAGTRFPFKKVIAVVITVVAVVLAAKLAVIGVSKAAAFIKSRPKAVKKTNAAPAVKPAAKQPQKAAKAAASAAASAAAVQVPKGEKLELSIRTRADVYVKVKADGSVIFDGMLKKGTAEKWSASNSFEISTSKAEALSAELNGADIGVLGKGAVKGLKLPK
ncbi:MAG: RodZ domain-containing protein [Candidatus Omnitrophota bacterium]|jgi:cytoskeletal protein RodZ